MSDANARTFPNEPQSTRSSGSVALDHNDCPPQSTERRLELSPELALRVEYVEPTNLKAYQKNPRAHSADQVEQIAESVKAFGFVSPLLIDAEGIVIAGHGRLAAAKRLKLAQVPVIRIDHLVEAQKKALRIADNRLAELSGWDEKLLAIEFTNLIEIDAECRLDFEIEATGFSFAQIDQLIESSKGGDAPNPDDDFEMDLLGAPVSGQGDLWLLGKHRLFCGDARDPKAFERATNGALAQVAICDPPYNVKIAGHVSGLGKTVHPEFAMASGEMSEAEFTEFLTEFLRTTAASLVPGAILFLFMDWRHQREVLDSVRATSLTLLNVCVWNKGSGGMGSLYRSQHELAFVLKKGGAPHKNRVELGRHGRCRTNVWNYPGLAGFGRDRQQQLADHPTVKNCAMIADAIRDVSDRGDLVIDPFSGSGTTIIAAAKTGRRACAIELEPKYVDVAIRRWERWSSEPARHAESGFSFAEESARRAAAGYEGPNLAEAGRDISPPRTTRIRKRLPPA
ncbi:ParB N-terminal domain-containing protein [Methylocystis sp. H62]|uniref:site-specific DNA-methyltransferase n=1 Tax=Methylocystis sp. H62 TaxID=2785789 RepID=UPI0018C3175C|nr:DNA methyltransferase [Methylocystis sp. H62]MBG0793057.1 ParB N-terminal domain-containing protein [Methylocystis sp. H62]